MDDRRLGRSLRAIRLRRGWRQVDVAARAGVSDTTISRIERGDLEGLQLGMIRRVAGMLEASVDLHPRWRGGDMDRLVSGRHAALADAVARHLVGLGWTVRPEVSFSIYGERGVVDLLARREPSQTVLVIEIKTEIVDVGELLGTLDRKRRLASRIAGSLDWPCSSASTCLIVADGSTNRRHVRDHAALLRAAFPADGRQLRGWLSDPSTPIAALAFWSDSRPGTVTRSFRPVRRVRAATRGQGAAVPSVGGPASVAQNAAAVRETAPNFPRGPK